MADPTKPTDDPPALPFAVDENEWESELAAWDAHLPILLDADKAPERPASAPVEPPEPATVSPDDLTVDLGPLEDDDNPFYEEPTTVVAGAQSRSILEDDGDDLTFASTPDSGVYASIVASAEESDSPFQQDPPPEPPVSLVRDPLPEMTAGAWTGGLRHLVTVPDTSTPQSPAPDYWKRLARLLVDELSIADTAVRQADLTVAAARVAEITGDTAEALRLYEDALTLQSGSVAALRARLRILEGQGQRDMAFATLARLCEATTGEEQALYRALHAEWALARGAALTPDQLTAIPSGIARALAEAEIALRRGDPAEVAAALEEAAHSVGGPVGSALLTTAARFNEAGGDLASAVAQRFVASRLDDGTLAVALGRLRDAARLDAVGAGDTLRDVLPALPAGHLKVSVARWAAALARRGGDLARAAKILNDPSLGTESPALVRDRLDLMLESASSAVPDVDSQSEGATQQVEALFARAAALSPAPEARAALAIRRIDLLAAQGETVQALAELEKALHDAPSAVPLALIAEALGRAATDKRTRAAAFRLWGASDPARAAAAALAAADVLDNPTSGARDDEVLGAMRAAVQAAPASSAFWRLAARQVRAGAFDAAADALAAGAVAWAGSALGPALAERAAEMRAAAAPEHASPPIEAVPGVGNDAFRVAFSRLQAASLVPREERHARNAALQEVLTAVADYPAALALTMVESAGTPEKVAAAWWAAGAAGEGDGAPGGRALRLQAVEWLAQSGHAMRAMAFAIELATANPDWRPAREAVRRLVRAAPDPEQRAQIRARLRFDPADPAEVLETAEALEQTGDADKAAGLFSGLAGGRFDADARRGLARTGAPDLDHPWPLPARLASQPEEPRIRLKRLIDAARGGRWPELVEILETVPPHEGIASPATLYTAAILSEGRAGDADTSARLLRAAMAAGGPGILCAARAADLEHTAAAIEALAARVAGGEGTGGARSAAALLAQAAEVLEEAGADAAAEVRLRTALDLDPTSLTAVRNLRRLVARRAAWADTVAACEREAACLVVPAHRVAALFRAATVAEADQATATPEQRKERLVRAAGLLEQVLAIEPGNHDAFDRLRILLEQLGDQRRLSEALGARIAVAANPFEITALRMARADLMLGSLGERAAAKNELAAILQKEPLHARALARLAELQFEDGEFAQAAELYISRAGTERSPERLREIFLRLGRIYTRHAPDAKRAMSAYTRVLQLEADNREALDALSDIYLAQGETRNALAMTQRLVDVEPDAERRVPYLIRVGQLLEKAGELRQAGARFRRAVDEAPRNITAIAELARHLERTHDVAGHRALLDHSLFVLRRELEEGRVDLPALRAAVPLLKWRGKNSAAAAAAQLLAALSPEAADREAVTTWAAAPTHARRLLALARPELDDVSFPAALPLGVKNIFRMLGETLSRGAPDIKRYELARSDRVPRGQAPRDIIDPIAAELGVRDFEVYLKTARAAADPAPLVVVPGDPPALIIGAQILKLGAPAVRFAAARGMRLIATHLDLVLHQRPVETGALIGGLVRQFVADYHHPEVSDDLMGARAASIAKLLPRRLRQEVMPFALESASAFNLGALSAAVRDGANAIGLLASGNLPVSLAVVLATAGQRLSLEAIVAHPEALALLTFALSDQYHELCRAME